LAARIADDTGGESVLPPASAGRATIGAWSFGTAQQLQINDTQCGSFSPFLEPVVSDQRIVG
jgi:hypothetical protein